MYRLGSGIGLVLVLVLRFCVLKLVHRRKCSEQAIFTASCRKLPALETIQLGSRLPALEY